MSEARGRGSVSWRALGGVLRTDVIRVLRDRFIVGLVAYLVATAVAMRWAIPWITQELDARLGFDFVPYEALLASHVVVQLSPMIVGMVAGYLLLETKESGALLALRTTPLGVARYLGWMVVGMALGSGLLCALEAVIIDVACPPWPVALVAGSLGTPSALVTAYLIGGLADTKTEAFAYSKITSLLPLIPSGAWFVSEPWQYVFGLDPAYWASKVWWSGFAGDGAWAWQAGAGLVVGAAATGLVYRLFVAALER